MKKIKDSTVNIVMYHYVRPIKNSKYPNIKGLEIKEFKNQIENFQKQYNIISESDFINILECKKIPKKPSILLTFDDGYKDHYKYAFPFLVAKKLTASFYPPIEVIKNNTVLDVNKIHFILEKELNTKKILNEINLILISLGEPNLEEMNLEKINVKSRFDKPETIIIKRLLQFFLKTDIKEKVLNLLFEKIINKNIKDFSKELYLNTDEVIEMSSQKMSFGSHGDKHLWWEYLSKKKQEEEIDKSINFFNKININTKNISICYPYGSFNATTLNILKKKKISFALTTQVGCVNKKNIENVYTLPRYDTNDFK